MKKLLSILLLLGLIPLGALADYNGPVPRKNLTGAVSTDAALQTVLDGKVDENAAITGATKTKITYDAKGLVTAGADATTTDISEGSNQYFTTARARLSLSGSGDISYDNISGVISFNNSSAFLSTVATNGTLVGDGTAGVPLGVNFVGNNYELTFYNAGGQLDSSVAAVHYVEYGANYYDDELTRISWKSDRDKYANWDASGLTKARTVEFQDRSGIMALHGDDISLFANDLGFLAEADLASARIFVGNASNVAVSRAMSGDAALSNTGVLTLTTVNSNVGSFGSSTSIPSFTVNGKGLITAASGNAVIAPAGTLTGTTLASGVVTSSLTTVGTLAAGNATAIVDAASTTAQGKVELAVGSEVNTGTDATRAVTPDSLAESYAGTKPLGLLVISPSTAVTTGDGKVYIRIPASYNGMNLATVAAAVTTTSSSGNPTVQIARGRQSSATSAHSYVDMLSTRITVDSTEYDSKDATAAAVIDTANDDVATGDLLRVDVDTAGTGTQGLFVNLEFRLP